MKETNIQRLIMMEMSRLGITAWRNNTGNGVLGQIVKQDGGNFVITNGRRVQFGLCVGSSDIIGITPAGQFIAIEVKTPTGAVKPEQVRFIEHVRKMGGLAAIIRNPDEIEGLINPLNFGKN